MTPSLESVVAQIKSALEAGPTSVFYIDQRLATACNPQSIRILLDALEEAQRDASRWKKLASYRTVSSNEIHWNGPGDKAKADAIVDAWERPK